VRGQLETLATADFDEVPDKFRPFAVRGAAIARLGQLCLGRVPVAGMVVRMFHFRDFVLPFLMADADEFFRQHAPLLVEQAGFSNLEEALLQSIQEHSLHQADVREKSLQNAQYFCASDSLQILACAWSQRPNPLLGLAELPRDWQALRGARLLLEAGRTEAELVTFAREACNDTARQHTIQGWHDRELCLAQLARIGGTAQTELESQRESMGHSFFGTSGRARGLAALVDEHPNQLLSLLDSAVRSQEASISRWLQWIEK
jgi:hypothetical protein